MTCELERFAPDVDMEIDPDIREAVLILRSHGVQTTESCQGGPGHACPEPVIYFAGNLYEGYRTYAIAKNYGLNVLSIAYECGESDGWLESPRWKMTFRDTNRKGSVAGKLAE